MNNEEKILSILTQMQSDMTRMQSDMTKMQADITGIQTDMTGVKADIAKMQADMSDMKEQLDRVDERSLRTAILLENEVDRKLSLLYEGHGILRETLAPIDRVEKLEDDVALLKDVVKGLKRAQ